MSLKITKEMCPIRAHLKNTADTFTISFHDERGLFIIFTYGLYSVEMFIIDEYGRKQDGSQLVTEIFYQGEWKQMSQEPKTDELSELLSMDLKDLSTLVQKGKDADQLKVSLDRASAEVGSLAIQKAQLENDLTRARALVDMTEKANEKLNERILNLEEYNEELKIELKDSDLDLADAETKLWSLRAELELVRADADMKRVTLEQELESLKDVKNNLYATCEKLAEEKDRVEKEFTEKVQHLFEEIEKLDEENEKLEERQAFLTRAVNAYSATIIELHDQRQQESEKARVAQEALSLQDCELTKAEALNEKLHKELEETFKELEETKQILAVASKLNTKNYNDCRTWERRHEGLLAEYDSLQSICEDLGELNTKLKLEQKEFLSLIEDYKRNYNLVEADNKSALCRIRDLNLEVEKLEKENVKLKHDHINLETAYDFVESVAVSYKTDFKQLELDNKVLLSELGDAVATIKKLQEENKRLQQRDETLVQLVESIETEKEEGWEAYRKEKEKNQERTAIARDFMALFTQQQ